VGQFDNDDPVLLINYGDNPITALGVPGTLLGGWNTDGTQPLDDNDDPLYPVHDDFLLIRPLGNRADGLATDALQYPYPSGSAQRWLSQTSLYPVDNQPISLDMRHKEFTGNVNPEWDGWGWRGEILVTAAARPANARAIGIYSDPECTAYLYTTGAFQFGQSEWQTDIDGNLIDVWFTECPLGRATTEQQDWHYALLFGAAQEGHYTLPIGSPPLVRNYWQANIVPPATGAWVDSGATVTSMAGTVTLVSNIAPFAPGQLVRIYGTYEATISSIWAGQGLVLTPYQASTAGAVIEIWE
jgi:hypothetical protein